MASDQNEGQSGQQNGPVDSINNIVGNLGRLKGNAGKKASNAEKDAKKALSWIKRLGSGGWALWVILFLAFATMGLALFGGMGGGGGGVALGGVPSPSGGTTISGPVPACADIDAALSRDLNATVQSGSVWSCITCVGLAIATKLLPEVPDCVTKQDFWKLWSHLTLSPSFAARLTDIPYRAELFRRADNPSFNFGYTGLPNKTQLINVVEKFYSGNYTSIAFWITHETTHMLQHRDHSLEETWDINFLTHADSACYVGGCLKTYGSSKYSKNIIYCNSAPLRQIHESMAEAAALYVYHYKFNGIYRINNFKAECPNTYDWIKTKLFGNYEFN